MSDKHSSEPKDSTKYIVCKFIVQRMELEKGHQVILKYKDNTQSNGDIETIFRVKGTTEIIAVIRYDYLYVMETPMKEFNGLLPEKKEMIRISDIKSVRAYHCKKCKKWQKIIPHRRHCDIGHYLCQRLRFTNEPIEKWTDFDESWEWLR